MTQTERIAYLKSTIEELLTLYFSGKKEPHKYDSFKDAKTITKAELAVNGLYHIAGSDEWTEHTFKSTFYDENNDIKCESNLKCKYQEFPCIVNDTVFGSSCSICRMNPNK